MDQAVDHVLASADAAADARGHGASSYAILPRWYRLKSEPSPSGGSARATIRDYAKKLHELSCAFRNGMRDVRLLHGKVDFSGLRDAYQGFMSDFPRQRRALTLLRRLMPSMRSKRGSVRRASCAR